MKLISSAAFLCTLNAVSALSLPKRSPQAGMLSAWSSCDLPGVNMSLVQIPIDCATLVVPLDYTNTTSPDLELSLIRANATKDPFLGNVLFNPGGPGASAVEDLALKGHIYSEVVGGHHNLIAFDPRGTGRTIPFACNINWTESPTAEPTQALNSRNALLQQDLLAVLEQEGWADSTFVADACYQAQSEYGAYLSTAFVVRDMVNIIDAIEDDGMLRFWGMSYGTLLGQTFAAMFPERVDRMVLDSVVDGPDYTHGYWLRAMEDTEKTLIEFFRSCISAGVELCPLANIHGPDTSPATLLSAMNLAQETLLANPLHAPPGTDATWNPAPPETIYAVYKSILFASLYHPARYPLLSALMYPLLTQNFTAILDPGAEGSASSSTNDETSAAPPASAPEPYNLGMPDAFWGVACTDATFRADAPEEMHWLVHEQEAVSGMADGFISKLWPCAQWRMKAAERFEGEFKAKTHFPMLIVNGEFDPCTPIASAHDASEGFEGSVVLTHGGQGHKFMRHPSICTARAVKAYFVNGTLPAAGTYCPPDVPAFEVVLTGGEAATSLANATLKKRGSNEGEDEDHRLLSRMLDFVRLDDGGDFGTAKFGSLRK